MLKSIEGIYRDGKIELSEAPSDILDETRVIVTFLQSRVIDLRAREIDDAQGGRVARAAGDLCPGVGEP